MYAKEQLEDKIGVCYFGDNDCGCLGSLFTTNCVLSSLFDTGSCALKLGADTLFASGLMYNT